MKRLIALALLLTACGSAPVETEVSLIEPPVPTPTSTMTVTLDASTPVVVPVDAPPVERMEAEQATDTVPFEPWAYVNLLPYDYIEGDEIALDAFTVTATWYGWSPEKIALWLPFVDDLIGVESGYCPNLFGGAIVRGSVPGCLIRVQGSGSDAGFGQLTSVHHGPTGWLCVDHGVCGREAVISSPWTSMSAVVWLLDLHGSDSWCYNDYARRIHKCGLAPDR